MNRHVFIHIPRTGGNSLLPHLAERNVQVIHHAKKDDLSQFKDDWVFSFLRDPCDRTISAYAYLMDGGRSDQDNEDANEYVRPFANFEDFVLNGLEKASLCQRHFRPQKYWISDDEGKVFTKFLGRTERIQADFDRICAMFEWPTAILGVENSSRRDGISCCEASRSVIQNIYADDYLMIIESENQKNVGLMERILNAFHKNYQLESRDVVWNECMKQAMQVELNELNLENMCSTKLVTGFEHAGGYDQIVLLAKALGIYGINNPENDAFHKSIILPIANHANLSAEQLLERIHSVLGFPIRFPQFSGNHTGAFKTEYGVISPRWVFYLWVLKRITELCPDRNSSIIEIGAGLGVLGYYLDGLGYKDYTTIDLALVNACQTYFLSKNLPHREIILSGDVSNPFSTEHRGAIKLLHSTDFNNVPKNRFDIMVNMDGLTEYGIAEASKYVQSDCAPMLLSINHEVNSYRVYEIKQPNRKMQYRYPFWLRPGYVEELYVNC